MSFNEKLSAYFSNFSLELGTPPARHLIHIYADYVELVTLFSNGNFVSSSDVQDRFKDEGILKQTEKTQDQAEENDIQEALVDKVFRLINERIILFGSDYPFLIHDNDKLRLKDGESIDERNKVYIFLLLCASLNIFNEFQPELTTEFEAVSAHVLKNFLPNHAIIKSFGKKSDYKGPATEKIKSLAADLKVDVIEKNLAEISARGTQERGLDLIGWIPFEDSVSNFLSILCQCACGKKWYEKLNDSRRYEKYMEFEGQQPIHSIFIPYNLVSHAKKTFFQNDEFTVSTLVFERRRILNYLVKVDFLENLESKILVDRCVEFMEDIV